MLAAAGTALLLAALYLPVAFASYVDTSATSSNSWQTGTVTFGANSPTGAIVTVAGGIAGSKGSSCVKVSYTGASAATVHLYVPAGTLTGTLGAYLSFQVRSGSGNAADCTDFTATATDYNTTGLTDFTKTLSDFTSASTSYATGVGSWAPNGAATHTYQLSWLVLPDNAAVSRSVSFDLTWEARS